MNDADARVLAAALLSPLSILIALPVGAFVVGLVVGGPLDIPSCIRAAAFLLVFVYPATLFVGLPLYIALRRLNLDSIWTAAVTGYFVAAAVPAFLRLDGISGTPPSSVSYWVNPLFLLGPVVAITFWWVVKAKSEPQSPAAPP